MNLRIAIVVVMLAACDPGGDYHVPGGIVTMDNGRRYILSGGSQTLLRTSAWWFTGSVYVSLGVMNNGLTPIVIAPDAFQLSDLEGPLERTKLFHQVEADGTFKIDPGKTFEMDATFRVQADRERLSRLTLTHDGVVRDDVVVPISITFLMD